MTQGADKKAPGEWRLSQSVAARLILREKRMFRSLFWISLFVCLGFLVMPIYMIQLGERVMTGRSLTTLIVLTVMAALVLAASAMLDEIRGKIVDRAAIAVDRHLNDLVFERLNQVDRKGQSAMLPTLFNDIGAVREFVRGRFIVAVMEAAWSPLFLIFIFLLHPVFFFTALVFFALSTTLTILNARINADGQRRQQQAAQEAAQFGQSVTRNIDTVRALGMAPRLKDRWMTRQRAVLGWQQAVADRTEVIEGALKFIRSGQFIFVQAIGTALFIASEVAPMAMMAAALVMFRALAPLDALVSSWTQFNAMSASARRLDQFLDGKSEFARKITLPRPKGVLALTRIAATPPGVDQIVLHDISFTLGEGRVLGVVGPSGAGKSCLARVIAGIWAPLRGSVVLGDHDLSHWNADELGLHIGYMPQDVELLPGTLAENISRFDPEAASNPERLMTAIRIAGVSDLVRAMPDGPNTRVGAPGTHVMSGGQRQRVALARAIYGAPALLVLDEPNSNLDAAGEQALSQAILEMKALGTTVVVVTHKMTLLNVCDDVLVLSAGAVQAYGARDDVVSNIARLKTTAQLAAVPGRS